MTLARPIPVLHIVRPAAGGIRQHVIELLRRTDPIDFTLSLAAPSDFLAQLPTGPFQTHVLDIAARLSPRRDLLAAVHLIRLLPHPPGRGVVHAHGLRAAFIAALAHHLRPFPFVFTAHNLVHKSRLTRLAVGFIGRRAVRVIAISQAVAAGLTAAGVPGDKIVVIPNGVDAHHLAAPHSSVSQGPPKVGGLGKSGFTVGCVARLSWEKGVDVLLRAAARLPEVAFLVAGDGPERAALKRLAPPNVTLTGRVADTRDIYRASDVVAVPSRQEGQGIVALEAMAAGRPIVASRVGGLAEMLTDDETALLVPPDDPAALADALTRLRDDPLLRDRLATHGRALVTAKYDVRRMVSAVEEVYTAIAPVRGRSS